MNRGPFATDFLPQEIRMPIPESKPWLDTTKPPRERAELLVAAMTLEQNRPAAWRWRPSTSTRPRTRT